MATNMVPEGKPTAELKQKLDTEDQAPEETKLTVDQWQKLLIQTLEKSGTLEWLSQKGKAAAGVSSDLFPGTE